MKKKKKKKKKKKENFKTPKYALRICSAALKSVLFGFFALLFSTSSFGSISASSISAIQRFPSSALVFSKRHFCPTSVCVTFIKTSASCGGGKCASSSRETIVSTKNGWTI